MAQTRVDYADIDGNAAPGVAGFTKMKKAGVTHVTLRAAYGRPYHGHQPCYPDLVWERDHQDALDAGLDVSAYLFVCVPKKGFTTPDPEVQVDFYADRVKLNPPAQPVYSRPSVTPGVAATQLVQPSGGDPYRTAAVPAGSPMLPPASLVTAAPRPRYGVPIFDMEEESDILTKTAYYDWFLRAAKRFRERYGVWPECYLSNRVWQEYTGGHLPGQLAACPLWIAKPWPWSPNTAAHMTPPAYGPTYVPQFGNQSSSWQYQGDALGIPGVTHTGDLSVWPIVGQGSRGQSVMWIQARAGNLTIDGDFGPATKARIQDLQRAYSLDADGLVGSGTRLLLGWLNPAPL